MAFFAVVLPNAFETSAKIDAVKAPIINTFKQMDVADVQKSQKETARLGQMIRDAIVTASAMKGKPPPVTPAPAPPAPAAVASPPPPPAITPYTEAEVTAKWATIKANRARRGVIAPANLRTADTEFNTYLSRLRPNISTTPKSTVDGELRRINSLLRGGGGTPRRFSSRRTYRQK